MMYGLVWWFLGPLTLMPLFMGMGLGVNWNGGAMVQAAPSLLGHLVFGATLGCTYSWSPGALEGLAEMSERPRLLHGPWRHRDVI